MKFIDDKNKEVKWWNRNYFYAGTIAIILLNILIFSFANDFQFSYTIDSANHWYDILYFRPTIRAMLSCFSHAGWGHLLYNMLCMAGVGFYLERKKGTFGTLLYVICGVYLSSIAIVANYLSVNYHGFSGVTFFLFAIVFVDYFFSLRREVRNKTNIIVGAIVLALIYLAMCENIGSEFTGFQWYPVQLIGNLGHYSAFLVGLVLGLIIQTTRLLAARGKIK